MFHHSLPKTLPSFMWHFLKPYKLAACIFVILAVLAGFWGPFNNMLIKYIINSLLKIESENTTLLMWHAGLIVLNFLIFDNVTWRVIGYINYKYQVVIRNNIIRQTMDQVLSESSQFFQDNLSGRISSQIMTLADNIEYILFRGVSDFIQGASLLFISFIVSFYVDPLFFYTLFGWFLVFSSFSIFMSRRFVYLADNHAKQDSILSGQLVDCIVNQSNIRIFCKKKYEIARINLFFLKLQKAFQKKELFIILLCIVQGLMIAIMIGCASYFLVYLYGKGMISIGDFALMLGLSMEVGHMMWHTMFHINDFNQAVGKCKQSLSALMVIREINDSLDAKKLLIQNGEITFDNIKFHYKGTKSFFQNISVTIKAGQKVGLVGCSGGGNLPLCI